MNYHYSSLLHLPYILLSDELKASRRDAHGDHLEGLLWFSCNPVIERTAIKQSAPPLRFAYSGDEVLPWRGVAKTVGFTSGVMRRLEKSGRAMGALPSQWLAKRGNLALPRVQDIEILYAGGWHGVDRTALHVERVEGGAVRLLGPGGEVAVVLRQRTPQGYYAYATNADTCQLQNLLADEHRKAG
jgi:hypothetical protein